MEIITLFDRSNTVQKADCFEKFSNASLYFLRNAVGNRKYSLNDNSFPTLMNSTIKKITRIVSTILAFILLLPLTLAGMAFLHFSNTHKFACAEITKYETSKISLQKEIPQETVKENVPAETIFEPPAPPIIVPGEAERRKFCTSLGTVDSNMLTSATKGAISFYVIRRSNGNVVLVSSGLWDPTLKTPQFELVAEAKESELGQDLANCWLFQAVSHIAHIIKNAYFKVSKILTERHYAVG